MDYVLQLRKVLNQIQASCEIFDSGIYDTAIQIAVSARVLFHEKPQTKSKSLVRTHLQRPDIRLLSTCCPLSGENGNCFGLVDPQLTNANIGLFKPRLANSQYQNDLDFDIWWKQEPVFKIFDSNQLVYREDIIRTAADKDGGAHVDSDLPLNYQKLVDGLGLQARVKSSKIGKTSLVTFKDAHLSALRQIGYEILNSKDLIEIAENYPATLTHRDILQM